MFTKTMDSILQQALQNIHADKDADEMLIVHLKRFFESDKCCMPYQRFYNEIFRQKIIKLIENYIEKTSIRVKWRIHEYNGLKFIKVYKPHCNSYFENIDNLVISDNSKILLYQFLREFSIMSQEQADLNPDFKKVGSVGKLRLQNYHFSTYINKKYSTPPKCANFDYGTSIHYISVLDYQMQILKLIKENQVNIITYDIGADKMAIPQFILDNASTENEHCRIIYSNNMKRMSFKYNEIIARRRGEVIGTTTGYQIPMNSVSSCNETNLLFTSTTYFLRCLMSSNNKEIFIGITHIILDDVQQRNFEIDLLLNEIRDVLSLYPNLKVLLLCSNPFNTKTFEDYFKTVGIVNLNLNLEIEKNVQINYLNKILKMINYMTPAMETYLNLNYYNKSITLNDKESQLLFNNLLDRYINDHDVEVFDKFCYLVQIENIPVDAQHSETYMNMLMGAIKNNIIEHVKILLKMNANVFLSDFKNRTAHDWAKIANSPQIIHEIQKIMDSRMTDEKFPEQVQRLKAYRFTHPNCFELDIKLITDLTKYLHYNSQPGSILVIVPSYDSILKIQYNLEHNFNLNKIRNFKIFRVHEHIKLYEINELLKENSTNQSRKIILSTQIIESFFIPKDILYIIDTGVIKVLNHSTGIQRDQWISKNVAEKRKCIAGISNTPGAICFRLYTTQDFSGFQQTTTPELMNMPLDNVCLFVKVLSPFASVKEYFKKTLCSPSNGQIDKSIQLLQSIGALEENETINILGQRLIDIPLPVQLGKVLLYGIFLQCVDPILTIISVLRVNDQFVLPDIEMNGEKLYACKETLTENSNSDHLAILRIFQKWQDDRFELMFHPMTESQFILDQTLQLACEVRLEIVGLVRSAEIIHANGLLNMNIINSFSNNWAMVKACFVAGMYPNICHIERDHTKNDGSEIKFKCNSTQCLRKMFIYPGSVLRELAPDSWNKKSDKFQTNWLFYHNAVHREKACRIHNNTLVSPFTIALFASNLKKSGKDIVKDNIEIASQLQPDKLTSLIDMTIDDWISYKMSKEDAFLIFNLRQKISHITIDFLENCDNQNKLARYRQSYMHRLKILEIISHVLHNEDQCHNFPHVERIGERPKCIPVACISDLNLTSRDDTSFDKCNEFDSFHHLSISDSSNKSYNNEIQKCEAKSTYNNKAASACVDLKQESFSAFNSFLNSDNYYSIDNLETSAITYETVQQYCNLLSTSLICNENLQNFSLPHLENNLYPVVIYNIQLMHAAVNKFSPLTSESICIRFFILPCWNQNDGLEYITQNKFHGNSPSLWSEICMKFVDNANVIYYIFLYNNEESTFYVSGFLKGDGTLDGMRLHEVFTTPLTMDDVITKMKMENENTDEIVNIVGFGEISYKFGYQLIRCMEFFQQTQPNST